MLEIRELTIESVFLRVFASVLLGGIIGIERGIKNRPAGLRTYMLVCIGACVVMMINQYTYQIYGTGDPARMAAQVISGIGFLGAGTIIVTSHNQIRGLTTAAGLWAAACIGLALGIGLYEVAAAGGLAVFLVLAALDRWDNSVRHISHIAEIYVELDRNVPLGKIIQSAKDNQIQLSNIQVMPEGKLSEDTIALIVTVKSKRGMDHEKMIATISELEGVIYLEEL